MTRHNLRFECTACGRCCYGGDEYFVSLTDEEAEKIRVALGVGKDWFRRRYLQTDEYIGTGLQFRDNGACILLGSDGRCKTYAQRPAQCRSYPFWPELTENPSDWQLEAGRCEGIGRGPVISRKTIRAGRF